MTAEMGEATFPVVSMSVAGYRVNDLHGYAQNMDCFTEHNPRIVSQLHRILRCHKKYQHIFCMEAERITEPSVLIKELTEQTGAFDIEYLAAVREGNNPRIVSQLHRILRCHKKYQHIFCIILDQIL